MKPRTSREHRKHLDPVLIAELYQEREWSSTQISAHQDVTVNLVLRTLHDHGVPVRRGGPPPRHPVDDVDPRLTALYADPEITALLRRHRIPRRNRPGTITERFPTAAAVTETFLREAYVDIGLATTHIEQLTGQPMERILSLEETGLVLRCRAGLAKAEARQAKRDAATAKVRRVRNTTDPQSRMMPLRGGGWLQGYNCQSVTSGDGVIIAVSVTDNPSDVITYIAMTTPP